MFRVLGIQIFVAVSWQNRSKEDIFYKLATIIVTIYFVAIFPREFRSKTVAIVCND